MSFETQFKKALKEMIDKDHDDYQELQYSNEIYVHVWSHPNGEGSFEIEAIIPHDAVNVPPEEYGRNTSTLSPEIKGVDQFYSDIETYLKEVTDKDFSNLTFQLMEVVDDGSWEQDASVYSTFELTV